MHFDFAGIPSVWSIFLVLFVVVPAIKWSIRGGQSGWRGGMFSGRRGRRSLRWEDRDFDGGDSRELASLRAELENRLGDVEALHSRVTELENRLDFTERLLAQQRDGAITSTPKPELIGRGDPPPTQ